MGVVNSIIHLCLKTLIASIALWLICLFYLDIHIDKIGPLLLFIMLCNLVANAIASMLIVSRG
jgi:hypothetical protein